MKNSTILILVAAITIALCITLIQSVSSQTENIQILTFSGYFNPDGSENYIVVGEAQNNGPNIVDYIRVTGTFSLSDGTPLISNFATSLTSQILPQQKAPFYLSFTPYDTLTGDFIEDLQLSENFTISVIHASPTNTSQYQDLEIATHMFSADSDGLYRVTGTVKNTGTQSTNKTWVVATFYDTNGTVVAIGYSNYLIPSSIAPTGTAPFEIYPRDYETVINYISTYSLQIQTLNVASPTPTPSPSPSPSPSPTASPSPTPSGSPSPTASPPPSMSVSDLQLIVIAAVIVIGILTVLLLIYRARRKGTQSSPSQ
jgi:hypothetical protein